jgi:TPR repeat protein
MRSRLILPLSPSLAAFALLACSGGQPEPAAPSASAAPDAPSAQASAAPTPPAATAAATAAPAPADPLLDGLTGEDLEWGKKCLEGEGSYCTKFGNRGELQTKDFAKALAWYKKGCTAAKQEPVCCAGQARLMINGQGMTADVEGGHKLWESTCSMDLGRDSCGELALALDKGAFGVKKDPKKAKEIYAKACDLRDLGACKKAGKKPPK